MMMRKYGRNLNINLGRMNHTSTQIETGRRFMRASEDPVNALKALQVRRNLSALNQYSANIDSVDSWLAQTEVAISAIKSHADKAVDLVLQGRNDTMAPEDRYLIATSLRSVQEALLKDLNSQVAGRYLLGGAHTKEKPFTVDLSTGELLFNGESVFEMGMPESGAGYTPYNPAAHEFESMESRVYVDLTGEFQLHNESDDIEKDLADKSTVFNMHTPGIDVIGVGPNNLYNLLSRIIYAFESEYKSQTVTSAQIDPETGLEMDLDFSVNAGVDRMPDIDGPIFEDDDFDGAFIGGSGLLERLQEAQLNALVSLIKVGEKANFITYLQERNGEYVYQAEVMQNKLEAMPPDEAIMMFKMQDYVYKACLQMGTYIFQPTLMDYIKR